MIIKNKIFGAIVLLAIFIAAIYSFNSKDTDTNFYLSGLNKNNKVQYLYKKSVELAQGEEVLFEDIKRSVGAPDLQRNLDDRSFLAFYEIEGSPNKSDSKYAILRVNQSGEVEELGFGLNPESVETHRKFPEK